jgi:hypothetical protein
LGYWQILLAIFVRCAIVSPVASATHNNNQRYKPLTKPTMNQYKATTRVPHISEPFVDWYDAETEEQARAIWESDRETYGLPEDASVKFELERGAA